MCPLFIFTGCQKQPSPAAQQIQAPSPTPQQVSRSPGKVKILFVGDLMFDRYVRQKYQGHFEDAFSEVKKLFSQMDLVVANLEGPIVDWTPPLNLDSQHLSFAFLPEVARALAASKIKLVSLANNHTGDQGQRGLEATRQLLEKNKIAYFGTPHGFDPATGLTRLEIKGQQLSFVGVNALEEFNQNQVLKTIKQEASTRKVFVVVHWGKEYQKQSNSQQQNLAHAFIEAGATAVIGSHPHVIQEVETYQEKPIFYSLGNFLFDQYFDEATQKGLAVEFILSPQGTIEYVQYLIDLHSSQPKVIS